MPFLRVLALVVIILLAATAGTSGQWFRFSTPKLPRLSDGTLNVDAATPRLPDGRIDLSGLWLKQTAGRTVLRPADGSALPFTDVGRKLYEQRRESNQMDLPSSRCLSNGIPLQLWIAVPFKILNAAPDLTVMLFEEFNHYRQIFTDGRQLIQGMDAPSWFGYSVGRWEGQSFVVTSHGFREESWLDLEGLPHSERLQLTERYLRPSFGKMTLQVTFDDPVMFTKTWTAAPIELRFVADTELMDRICENERDRAHLVGK